MRTKTNGKYKYEQWKNNNIKEPHMKTSNIYMNKQ